MRGAGARARLGAVALSTCIALGCATIDTSSTVSIQPRAAPVVEFGEQLVAHEFVADYVQLGPRLLVEIRELGTCVTPRHVPVLRIEHVTRKNRGFVAWDFALGLFTGAFAALAFAQPQLFSNRLIDGQGREVYDYRGAYVVGGVFSGISAGLLSAGIVDALRSRDTSHYADAYELERGPERPCAGDVAAPLSERALRLQVGEGVIELEATTDDEGRARFELPPWPDEPPVAGDGRVSAVIEVTRLGGLDVEPRVLVVPLWVPYDGAHEANAGTADTRSSSERTTPIEGPSLPEEDVP